MKLSLVMATIKRTAEVQRLLRSLEDQTDRRFELIVVDQNGDDRLVPLIQAARQAGLEIVYERMAEPNLSGARNRGIELARCDVVGFPDDDCWYEPDVVCRVLALGGDGIDGVIARWQEHEPQGRLPHELSNDLWRKFRAAPASSITLFLNRTLLLEHGGFDARLGVSRWFGAAEETDLVLRLLADGARLRYSPEVIVHHPFSTVGPSGSLAQLCRHARSRERGTGAIYAKHRLSPFVILRGFVAPLLNPFLPPKSFAAIVVGIFISLGRIEGFLRWRFCQH